MAKDTPKSDLPLLLKTAREMESLCIKENGVGLSAAQVGIPWKLFVIKRAFGYDYLVDCSYRGLVNNKQIAIEGCLSIKDEQGRLMFYEVHRYPSVQITGKRLMLGEDLVLSIKDVIFNAYGKIASVFQHEIDHQFQRELMIDVIGKKVEIPDAC